MNGQPREKGRTLGIARGERLFHRRGIDPDNEVKGPKLLLLHIGLCPCTFLVGLDFKLIATAIPVITSDFHSIGDLGWYGSAFLISLCSSQPVAGKTYSLFSKKVAYLSYVALFEVGSFVCALAPSSPVLIVGRATAGLGASGIFAGGLVILTTVIPLHKRAVWTGTLNSTFAIASIVGPILGGALTQHVTWRWCFYINLPIAGFSAVVILLFSTLDVVGFLLFAGSVSMLLIALQFGGLSQRYSCQSANIIGLFAGAGVVTCICVGWTISYAGSSFDSCRLFTSSRNISLICASAFFANGAFQCIIYWLPIRGVKYLPTVISDVLTSLIAAGLVNKLGRWNPFLTFATAMVFLGGGLLTTLHPSTSDGHWIGFQIVANIGVRASVPQDLVPVGAITLLFVNSGSCAIFLAIGEAVFQTQLKNKLADIASAMVANEVISAGASGWRSFVPSTETLVVISVYSSAVTRVFYLTTAAPVLSFLLVTCTRWTSTKDQRAKEENLAEESA
ncbi:MFS general substrate transporter [Aspergillus eucalypticola CBS 122712]|uniref:MFS general substrate transporter n=1 Tax=Aspergillus eucalypticola (strain CBS 122712 / IBT 29274) TaxID=1448314 RepID=A0A317VAE5_ASPEC|nr:MFS general substrate transporter [Aspergillus eucalypticola CBS 122712]PWY71323.1 MFS general substrate transporter [Aspergillus eucalypticola CBS 122712]